MYDLDDVPLPMSNEEIELCYQAAEFEEGLHNAHVRDWLIHDSWNNVEKEYQD